MAIPMVKIVILSNECVLDLGFSQLSNECVLVVLYYTPGGCYLHELLWYMVTWPSGKGAGLGPRGPGFNSRRRRTRDVRGAGALVGL
jgi:hypothetical protein